MNDDRPLVTEFRLPAPMKELPAGPTESSMKLPSPETTPHEV